MARSTTPTLRVDAPFTGGVCTDTPPGRLRADQTPYAENMVVSEGVAVERGGWSHVGEDDPFTASSAALASCRAVRFQGEDSDDLMASTGDGYVGVATDGANGVVFTDSGVVYYPRAFFMGEVIWCPQDGTSPIRRTVKLTSSVTTGTGTYSIVAGQTLVTGSGTNFDPHVPVGSYLYNRLYRVVARESDTRVTLAESSPGSVGAQATDPTSYGVIGLKTLVTDGGTSSHAIFATSVTGKATSWSSSPPGSGQVAVGDFVANGSATDPDEMLRVTAVADTTLTVAANGVGEWTDEGYAVLRNAVGTEACVHRNTLWFAGVDWNPNGLYKLPLGSTLGALANPAYSTLTEGVEAAQLDSVDVGGEDGKGRIVALASSGDALWVHLDDSLYRVTGEWPALNVQHVADYGTREIRAVVAADDVVYFAGTEGVFALRGDSLENLCEARGRRGGRLSEWRQQITRSTRCVVGVARGHLYISTGDATRECWVYDIRNDRWCGNFTSESGAVSGIEGATYMDSARDVILDPVLEDVGRDRLLMVTDSTTTLRIGDVSTTIPDNPGGGVEVADENLGRFRADTPTNIAGSIARQKRVAGVKVGYVLAGDDAMTLDVDSNVDEAATSTPEVALPSGDAYDVETVRIPPTTGYIGRLGRSFQLSIRRSASPTSASRVAVHFLEFLVGERRPRA